MRVQILLQRLPGKDLWRLCEADGCPVSHWLPWDPTEGALDRGGFEDYRDALAFKLGIDLIRAEAGLVSGWSARDVDLERDELDADRRGRSKFEPPVVPLFEAA